MRLNCYRNSLLSFTRNLPRKTLQLKIWYMVTWLYSLWDGYLETCFRCKLNERISFENIKRELSSNSISLFIRFKRFISRYAYKRSSSSSFNEKNIRKRFSKQTYFKTINSYNCKKRIHINIYNKTFINWWPKRRR